MAPFEAIEMFGLFPLNMVRLTVLAGVVFTGVDPTVSLANMLPITPVTLHGMLV